jgi:hypothetical protein
MKKRINGKLCDTETAKKLGTKCEGEFGDPKGYEEQLFMTRTNQHFIYGVGGPESKYVSLTIELVTDEQAEEWKKANIKTTAKENKAKKKGNTKRKKNTKKDENIAKEENTEKKQNIEKKENTKKEENIAKEENTEKKQSE